MNQAIPQSAEAEICTLGSMMLQADTIADVTAIVSAADFYSPAHRTLFEALVAMQAAGKPIDLVTVHAALLATNRLGAVGGQEYLIELAEGVPSSANAAHYAGIVRDKSLLRGVLSTCHKALGDISAGVKDVSEFVDRVEQGLYALRARELTGRIVMAGEAVNDVIEHASAVLAGTTAPNLMTGFTDLDRSLGGFGPGEVIVMAGDTGCGKTALADTISLAVAARGEKVLIVSCEMMSRERGKRLLQSHAGVPGQYIKLPRSLTPEHWQAIWESAAALEQMPIGIYAHGTIRPADIAIQARRASASMGGLDLIVVDYLQLLTADRGEHYTSMAERYGTLAWKLKCLAMDMGLPVLLLCQLNREGKKAGRPPSKHDLRGSGAIEDHASGILLLHRPKGTSPEANVLQTWLRVAKARDGIETPWRGDHYPAPAGAIVLRWQGETTTFYQENTDDDTD